MIDRLTEPGLYRDHEVKGLGLRIKSATNRSWVLRYSFQKKPRENGLGPYPLVSLSMARQKARDARLDLLAGIDPVARRREQEAAAAATRAKAQTFQEATERWFQKASAEWKTEQQGREFRAMMASYVLPHIGSMSVAEIDTPAVLKILQRIWAAKPAVAAMVRQRIEKILTAAAVGGFRPTGDNPARWQGHLAELLPSHGKITRTKNHAALPYRNVPAFMAKLRAKDTTAAKALQFIVLTAVRKNEALGATWSEIDMEAKVWTIPARRMKKGKRDHTVPLSDAVASLLESLYREDGNDHVFVGARPGSAITDSSLRFILKNAGSAEATLHGFRSAFRDWAGDKTHFPREICEAALSHAVGDQSERSYRRGTAIEKRRQLMAAWSSFCMGEAATGDVLQFRKKAAKAK